ncbi:GHMP kinase [Patescibacteria group bacterium]|nr:GHMP kinase [Patescibacteria group bacterium]MBU2579462.1 GHMP kinase [Patescibacteria group bacterium]MCG2700502.1 GHMP kinase [Candidatus Parcubacteria bacterium]
MIISKTPLRISFVGGGTDLEAFYKHHYGMVVNAAINKYIYICVHRHFDGNKFLLKYSKIEEGYDVNKIKNNLIREAMKLTKVSGVEIVSMSDMPVTGTGLGSSSSFIVGVLNALYAYKGEYKSPEELARDACKIEIDILNNPIGKQDQYIAAYGGLRSFTFHKNGQVKMKEIVLNKNQKKELDSNLLLFYTDKTRKANSILSKQKDKTEEKIKSLLKMRNLAKTMKECMDNCQLDKFGELLRQNWIEKRQLVDGITDSKIDYYYQKAIDNGAVGGKLCGAGGGGFLLFYCEKNKQNRLRKALSDLEETPFSFELNGSKIIHDIL